MTLLYLVKLGSTQNVGAGKELRRRGVPLNVVRLMYRPPADSGVSKLNMHSS